MNYRTLIFIYRQDLRLKYAVLKMREHGLQHSSMLICSKSH